jgi:hypothetical protein
LAAVDSSHIVRMFRVTGIVILIIVTHRPHTLNDESDLSSGWMEVVACRCAKKMMFEGADHREEIS